LSLLRSRWTDARVVRGVQRRSDLLRDPDGAPDRQATDAIDLVGEQRASRYSNTMYGTWLWVNPMSVDSTMFG